MNQNHACFVGTRMRPQPRTVEPRAVQRTQRAMMNPHRIAAQTFEKIIGLFFIFSVVSIDCWGMGDWLLDCFVISIYFLLRKI
jgi:hypothetical protein